MQFTVQEYSYYLTYILFVNEITTVNFQLLKSIKEKQENEDYTDTECDSEPGLEALAAFTAGVNRVPSWFGVKNHLNQALEKLKSRLKISLLKIVHIYYAF